MVYRKNNISTTHKRGIVLAAAVLAVAVLGGLYAVLQFTSQSETLEQKVTKVLRFDESVSLSEQSTLRETIAASEVELDGSVDVTVETSIVTSDTARTIQIYVPVTTFNSVRQNVTTTELAEGTVYMSDDTEEVITSSLADTVGAAGAPATVIVADITTLLDESVAFIPLESLDASVKLLAIDDNYYLDTLNSGAVFREVVFAGPGAATLAAVSVAEQNSTEDIYKVNMTGVTALTRIMQRKLATVNDPLYFSALIGEFLADADLTHVSNEVSFKPNCGYSDTLFCSPPEFIETLKASGVDLVELTGNHNNDLGSEFNTQTIEQYTALGWGTFGGGLNTASAAVPFVSTQKGSNITFLAYNFPDSPNGGAIAGEMRAGANSFDFARIETEIAAAKQKSDFIVVNVQYWECYAYPDGYIEFPQCDKPIGEQEATFKKLVDLGADMVVGSSAHQPQTYELYKGKPIYYGLGNLYFDQTQWPGTERGIILTHYFAEGELLQTKLTPTVYGEDLQTRVMTAEEADYLLTRLSDAR